MLRKQGHSWSHPETRSQEGTRAPDPEQRGDDTGSQTQRTCGLRGNVPTHTPGVEKPAGEQE